MKNLLTTGTKLNLEYIGIGLGVIGALSVITKLFTWLWKNRRRRTWRFVRKKTQLLYTRISTNYSPEIVVSIAREGTVIASLLALNNRLRPLLVLERHFEDRDGKTVSIVSDTIPDQEVRNKKVLLVDCEVNTGDSMKFARKLLLKKGADEVRTAAFMQMQGANFTVDFHCDVYYRHGKHLYMPWEWTPQLKEIRHGSKKARLSGWSN